MVNHDAAAADGDMGWRKPSRFRGMKSSAFQLNNYYIRGNVSACLNRIKPPSYMQRPPLIIGHRGASFDLPEHTLEGYRLALELGADYIEPDLIPTKDGHLVAIHSFDLNITTDVQRVFPHRARHPQYTGNHTNSDTLSNSGYYVHDFTLEEIKSLRVKQRLEDTPARTSRMDYMFTVPTLVEILDLLYDWTENVLPVIERSRTKAMQQRPGVYIELKNPSWILEDTDGKIRVEDVLLNTITNHPKSKQLFFSPQLHCSNKTHFLNDIGKYEYSVPPLVFQCFELETLQYLRRKIQEANESTYNNVIPPSVLLVSDCGATNFWSDVATVTDTIDAIGPDKSCLLDTDYANAHHFMEEARSLNLAVHPWTERLELEYVSDKFSDAEEELIFLFCEMGVDGIFAENVGLAKRVAAVGCSHGVTGDPKSKEFYLRGNNLFYFCLGVFVGGIVGLMITRCWSRRSPTVLRRYQPIQPLSENDNQQQTVQKHTNKRFSTVFHNFLPAHGNV